MNNLIELTNIIKDFNTHKKINVLKKKFHISLKKGKFIL